MRHRALTVLSVGLTSFIVGCLGESKPDPPLRVTPPNPNPVSADYGSVDSDTIQFKDDATTNAGLDQDLTSLTFTNQKGEAVALKDYLGTKHLILVMTRGYNGAICPYCSTQTSRLIANYKKFTDQNAEVVVVYPLEKQADLSRLDQFLNRVKTIKPTSDSIPFPMLVDVELKAVDALGIRRDLSKPATYIFDKAGHLRFAYVGNSLADRPSIKAMLGQLESLNKDSAGAGGS